MSNEESLCLHSLQIATSSMFHNLLFFTFILLVFFNNSAIPLFSCVSRVCLTMFYYKNISFKKFLLIFFTFLNTFSKIIKNDSYFYFYNDYVYLSYKLLILLVKFLSIIFIAFLASCILRIICSLKLNFYCKKKTDRLPPTCFF